MLDKHHISLSKILEIDDKHFNEILEGKKNPSQELLTKVAEFFYFDVSLLTDEDKELPHESSLQVDEMLLSARQGEYVNEIEKKKNKNVIKRNFNLLDKKDKKRLIINLVLTALPFLALVLYSCISSWSDAASTLSNYKNGDTLSTSQQKLEDSLPRQDEGSHFATIKVGAEIDEITNISASDESFVATLTLRYDFNQLDYHRMYWEYVKGETFDKYHFYTEEDLKADNFCLNATGDGYLEYSDSIPDVLQFNFEDGKHMSSEVKPLSVSTLYIDEQASFPGEKTSNVFTDKNDEFCIGNGKIAADTLEYTNKGEGYIDNNGQYRYFQKLHFSANIHKTFDNPRYPLDTAQFHVYIQPTRDSKYIRYEADQDMSGLKSYFRISSGYRLIKEKDGIKNFNVKLNYYQDIDRDVNSKTYGQEIIKTQLEVTIRANKHGFLVFVNSFLNIISVAIWLLLALYNQTYNKEDSMSMIGTGFFAAISAVLLGFSFVSGTESFALTTLINIFTMAMVLILGYESLSARRAVKLNNSSIIAYKTARVRILFYFLVTCSVIMYILVPAFSYLWIL